jgi:hypothetical protein
VLGEQAARPEQVNEAAIAGELLHRLLEGGDGAAADAEDVEELVPEGLALGGFACFAFPIPGKRMARWRISFHESGTSHSMPARAGRGSPRLIAGTSAGAPWHWKSVISPTSFRRMR